MTLGDWLASAWGITTAAATLGAAVVASGHAILYKRDTRATVLWVGFIWLAPVAGPIFYLLLGINRIRRRAVLLRSTGPRRDRAALNRLREQPPPEPPVVVVRPELGRLIRLVERVAQAPLQPGNRIEPRFHGDQAYPDMIAAIDAATHSVGLCTYIFDRDPVGLRFVEALRRAVRRGVQVRVLVDDTGARYSFPSIVSVLRKAGVRVARFLPTLAPVPTFALNMRCHRKLLLADGRIAFTGGMNIRAGHETDANGRLQIADTHFRIEGPVVAQLRDVFADDWLFTTGEVLEGPAWFPDLVEAGDAYARAIDDGPDENLDRLRWTLLGALASATSRVCIATPYFLPDPSLISALNTTALRGVSVEIVLPVTNNLPFVQWASTAHLWQMLERGCRVHMAPGPFDHSKIMIVDGAWSFFGSSNWDPRSLRLNFELDVECYSMRLARELSTWFDARRDTAHEVTLAEVNARPLPIKLRDGIARLATPFL